MPRAPRLTVENIVPDLRPLAVPIDWITTLPGNPRRGQVDAVARSYAEFGQRKPIVVNKTGEVDGHPIGYTEAGNHQLLGARSLAWEYIAVVWVDDDEATAKAFSLADNRLHDLGEYDNALLADFAAEIANSSERGLELLDVAGYNAQQTSDLLEQALAASRAAEAPLDGAESNGDGLPGSGAPGIGLGTPVISTSIVFDTEAQQAKWYEFMRYLRSEYPDAETTGERIEAYVIDHVEDSE